MQLRTKETNWTPFKALAKSDEYIESLMVPDMKVSVGEREQLEFSDLMNADNKKLEEFLTMYGGYKAYLEIRLSEIESIKGALEAAFDEGYATAVHKISDERETNGQKKLTREELRGAVLSTYDQLKELRKEIIERTINHTRIEGLLKAYASAFQTVSRVVALRTFGSGKDYA